jgi:general secretion pathway protein G
MTPPSRLTAAEARPVGALEDWLPLRGRWLGYLIQSLQITAKVSLGLALIVLLGPWHPCFLCQTKKGQRGAAKAQIDNFRTAIDLYRLDYGGRYPKDLDDLIVHPAVPAGKACQWKGPYLADVTTIPADPWGNPYVYHVPGSNGEEFELLSLGEDGRPGGEKDAADIVAGAPLQQTCCP